MLRPLWMVDLGGLGKEFTLVGKEGVKCHCPEKCQKDFWKCYIESALLSLVLHCSALARDPSTLLRTKAFMTAQRRMRPGMITQYRSVCRQCS